MTNTGNVISVNRTLIIRALIGTGIGLALILTFILGVDQPNPEWHKTWWVRPLVVTPLAGTAGGLFFHFMYDLGKGSNLKKILFIVFGVAGFLIALWMGTVLGLAGTMWD